jgi:hypothetical protein
MKQTAVEWLVEELTLIEPPKWVQKAVKKAKTMEKQQIVDFAYVIADDLACGVFRDKKAMEKRYEEFLTFRSKEDND